MSRIQQVARALVAAEAERQAVARFTASWDEFSIDAGYRVQAANIEARILRGHRRVGVKLGLTSPSQRRRMGLVAPLTGILTDDMQLAEGLIVSSELIHPKVEPEIVFAMGEDLASGTVDVDAARRAVATVHAGIEVTDSRYIDFDFRLPDVVADNASSARFLVSPRGLDPAEIDLASERVTLMIDGEQVASSADDSEMVDPYLELALAANDLISRGEAIHAGDVVLSGALTKSERIFAGSLAVASFDRLGTAELRAV